jgi:hypothetical protein
MVAAVLPGGCGVHGWSWQVAGYGEGLSSCNIAESNPGF